MQSAAGSQNPQAALYCGSLPAFFVEMHCAGCPQVKAQFAFQVVELSQLCAGQGKGPLLGPNLQLLYATGLAAKSEAGANKCSHLATCVAFRSLFPPAEDPTQSEKPLDQG